MYLSSSSEAYSSSWLTTGGGIAGVSSSDIPPQASESESESRTSGSPAARKAALMAETCSVSSCFRSSRS